MPRDKDIWFQKPDRKELQRESPNISNFSTQGFANSYRSPIPGRKEHLRGHGRAGKTHIREGGEGRLNIRISHKGSSSHSDA